ncbi:MAG: hypothetical protein L0332_00320 [Chloroflexi bacterium]|nr:hypothetical protein [Chloroflexota bacterium]MCI0576798.1 hypothetical protein [Chloroflexota bacterium]MCI0643305.1 hypothetical protein [Chloroflexota bacterium]MCI0725168.1 hypothetical protein [Chloroflexota bacterium]
MEKREKRPTYRAYLLRFWCDEGRGNDRPAAWRFSLEDAHTGARRGFADFEALVFFLAGQLEADGPNRPEDIENRR